MKKILYTIALLLLFASCEKVLPIDGSDVPQQMVLNGVPSVGKELFVNFSYTHFFLEDNVGHAVDDVAMAMTVNGTEYAPSKIEGCNYFFNHTVGEDDTLGISITAGGKTVTANTYVPKMPRVENLRTMIDTTQVFDVAVISFTLNDHSNYKEYYSFTVAQRDSGARMNPFTMELDTVDTVYNTMFLCMGDPALTAPEVAATEALGGYFYTRLLTTDGKIDGTSHPTTLMLMMLKDTNEVVDDEHAFLHEYTLHIESVAPDRYRYLQSVDASTSMMNIFAEQAQIYGNVSGALGIFAGTAHYKAALSTTDTLPAMPYGRGYDHPKMMAAKRYLEKKSKKSFVGF